MFVVKDYVRRKLKRGLLRFTFKGVFIEDENACAIIE